MSTASEMIALYNEAEKKVLKGQAYSIDGTSYTRANLTELRKGRQEWENKLRQEESKSKGGSNMVTLADFR